MRVLLGTLFVAIAVGSVTPIVGDAMVDQTCCAQALPATEFDALKLLTTLSDITVAGVLLLVIYWAQAEKREMRVAQGEREKMWAALANQAHDDSEKLNTTLRDITRHCAETMVRREK